VKKVILIIILIIIIIGGWFYYSSNKEKVKIITRIKEYDYALKSNCSEEYKDTFMDLKEVLEENYDEEKYANLISKLFVLDFYDLKSKKSNVDIGGTDFIYPDIKDEFSNNARKTIYKFVGSSKKLPSVKDVKVNESVNEAYEGIVNDDNSYLITLEVKYEKDLKYPSNVVLRLVHKDKKLYIIEIK
jgi:hypothetical protein